MSQTRFRQDDSQFRGLSSGDVAERRAELFASLESVFDGEVIALLKEELRTASNPAVLANVAAAIGRSPLHGEEIVELLEAAASRISLRDEFVDLGGALPDQGKAMTVREHLLAAATRVRRKASGCTRTTEPLGAASLPFALLPQALEGIVVEDQDGQASNFLDLISSTRSLIGFFYTRCENPLKCSLTVSRLAGIAKALKEVEAKPSPQVLAISYDSAFDHAARLRAYGRDRDFPFGSAAKLLRCKKGWPRLKAQFDLRVGYNSATVNDHAREAFFTAEPLQSIPVEIESLSDTAAWVRRLVG